jgi:hypothetical protein
MRPAAGALPLRYSEFELFTRANVRFGSKADIALGPCHVRFSPESGHHSARWRCLLCATFGHTRSFVVRLD